MMEINVILCDGRDPVTEAEMLQAISTNRTIYVDLEGIRLGREGTISLLQFTTGEGKPVYLLDIVENPSYLSAPGSPVRRMLESDDWEKWMWDPRADADALFHKSQIRLSPTKTVCIQLAEVAFDRQRGHIRRYLHSMTAALKRVCSSETFQKVEHIKTTGKYLFSEHDPDIFIKRPLPDALVRYCGVDVGLLPLLRNTFYETLSPQWKSWVHRNSKEKVELAFAKEGLPTGRDACLAP